VTKTQHPSPLKKSPHGGRYVLLTHLGWDTVQDIVKSDLQVRYAKVPLKDVQRIAIDELYLGSKTKYVTLVIDLDSGRVLWVGPGKGGAALKDFWPKLRAAKAKIVAAACDMSAAYWCAVQEHLPNTALVFDHFDFARLRPPGSLRLSLSLRSAHIVKLANEAIDGVRRGLQRTLDVP
jgi:transposase